MHALAGHPEPRRHLDDRHAVVEDLENGLIALLHKPQLHQHDNTPRVENLDQEAQPVSQPRVTRLPEPPSPNYRNRVPGLSHTYRSQRVKHLPGPHTLSRDERGMKRCARSDARRGYTA